MMGTRRDGGFDGLDEFVPDHLPDPGPFLDGHSVLVDADHVAFHAITRDVFEERGVYDPTFGYNLARLNLDRGHPDAGFRYAEDETGDTAVLRAEFTPTTEFCPVSRALVTGAFRAWNGCRDRNGYELVRVRCSPMHHESDAIDVELERLERAFRATGSVRPADGTTSVRGDGFGVPY